MAFFLEPGDGAHVYDPPAGPAAPEGPEVQLILLLMEDH